MIARKVTALLTVCFVLLLTGQTQAGYVEDRLIKQESLGAIQASFLMPRCDETSNLRPFYQGLRNSKQDCGAMIALSKQQVIDVFRIGRIDSDLKSFAAMSAAISARNHSNKNQNRFYGVMTTKNGQDAASARAFEPSIVVLVVIGLACLFVQRRRQR